MAEFRLVQLDPGHFHAALIQKETYAGVSKGVSVYAPLSADVADYLARVAQFNTRTQTPTCWELDLHCGSDYLERMIRDRAGNVAVIAGRNRPKMDRIQACLDAGMNVLADKPWIIRSEDLPKLEAALETAERKGLVAYDIMTERFEITSILQRALVNDRDILGELESVTARSIHHIMKLVAGEPVRRPAWFFDLEEYGEGLADVGTHVVDLVQWTAFPDQALDYRTDVRILGGKRWPTVLSRDQFQLITGEAAGADVAYYCNNTVDYTLRGIPVALDIRWNWQAPQGGGDVYEAAFQGTRATVEIRQKGKPELYIVPFQGEVVSAVRRRLEALQAEYPGLAVEEAGGEMRVQIPEWLRVGHEAHFAQVTRQFFEYLQWPASMPGWEKPNMLVKYSIATKGTEIGQASQPVIR